MFTWFQRWLNSKKESVNSDVIVKPEINLDHVPKHIAIIMDGNGRWAKNRGLPRVMGHRMGMKTVKSIAIAASDIGVKYLTMYAFSTENWKRPKLEVEFLMKLPEEFIAKELNELNERNMRLSIIGNRDEIPKFTLNALERGEEQTKNNTGLHLNFAFNYGGRSDIVMGISNLCKDIQMGKMEIEGISESVFANYLLTAGIPDPELFIRTSGEIRISNFLIWQLAYTELWFTNSYWPDFSVEEFHQAIMEYQQRNRRFGAL